MRRRECACRARGRRFVVGVFLLACAGLLGLAAAGLLASAAPALLTLAPAIACAALMLARPYLGERTIARLRRGCTCASRRGIGALQRPPARPERAIVRGGRLLAAALAGRGPPLLAAGTR